jgi:aspartate beta-hydroxylase
MNLKNISNFISRKLILPKKGFKRLQRPTKSFIEGLESKPWWNGDEFLFTEKLEQNYEVIKQEYLHLVKSSLLNLHPQSSGNPRGVHALTSGNWNYFELWSAGYLNEQNALETPKTVELISTIPEFTTCCLGNVYFSVLPPGTIIKPHCGPHNARIRFHLGLQTPPGVWIRVGNEKREWKEGKCLIFDDSWEHEVQNNSDSFRAVLILDAWHPDLTREQRDKLLASRKTQEEIAFRRGFNRTVNKS